MLDHNVRNYWIFVLDTRNKDDDGQNYGPYETREQSLDIVGKRFKERKTLNSGYGTFGAHFDIQWLTNPHYVEPDYNRT